MLLDFLAISVLIIVAGNKYKLKTIQAILLLLSSAILLLFLPIVLLILIKMTIAIIIFKDLYEFIKGR